MLTKVQRQRRAGIEQKGGVSGGKGPLPDFTRIFRFSGLSAGGNSDRVPSVCRWVIRGMPRKRSGGMVKD